MCLSAVCPEPFPYRLHLPVTAHSNLTPYNLNADPRLSDSNLFSSQLHSANSPRALLAPAVRGYHSGSRLQRGGYILTRVKVRYDGLVLRPDPHPSST